MGTLWQRLNELETPICATWNQRARRRSVRGFFRAISRAGDGAIWYLTMLLLPVSFGMRGAAASAHMLVIGIASLVIYRVIKARTHRPRPCDFNHQVHGLAPALDEFSFPSGHTLHAVAFTVVIAWYFPTLSAFYVAFTVLVAASRLLLGLHYPSDVLAGAAVGASVAALSLALV